MTGEPWTVPVVLLVIYHISADRRLQAQRCVAGRGWLTSGDRSACSQKLRTKDFIQRYDALMC